ncbi:MAG: lipid-A-disaccharide synthase [Parvularculaceae bacterium]|nr:lipid-A-disaccharide synthase [Parvularculaceae bacterium]
MTDAPLKIMLAAVEPSADSIGASLMRDLKELAPSASYSGCGGPLMEREGLRRLFPIEPFAVMGATDVLRVAPLAMRRAEEFAAAAKSIAADVAVFIDGWAFSRLATTRLRKQSPATTSVKFVAPQVWASRPQRVKFVKRYFDGVLTLFPFEPPYFTKEGVRAEFVGNPNFQAAWRARGNAIAFRARHRLDDIPLLAVLPGSRRREVTRLAPPFRRAVERLIGALPDLRVVTPVAEGVSTVVRKEMRKWPGDPIFVDADEKYDAMAAANAALTASGTASTELAVNRTPMIVAYKVDPLTAFWARRVKTTPYASIINVVANRFVIPEFIQEACEGSAIADALLSLFNDPAAYVEQASAFDSILKELGVDGPSASRLAALRVLEWAHLGKKRSMGTVPPSSGPAP